MRYIITGGAGFIGTNLVRELLREHDAVHIVDTLVAGKRDRIPEGVILHEVDIRDTKALTDILQEGDIVVHLAALPRVQFSIEHPMDSHDVNVNGTLSVLEAARAKKIKRIVYAASSSAYGNQEALPLSETLSPEPQSPYGVQKYIGEELLQVWSKVYGIETVSLRFFNVYGPFLDPEGAYALVIGRFLKLRSEGKPLTITGDGTQTRDFTHVYDVVDAIKRAAHADTVGNGEVLNVGAGHDVSINELAELIGGEIEYIAPRLEPKHTQADNTKIKTLLGWEPRVSLVEGVAELKKEWNLT